MKNSSWCRILSIFILFIVFSKSALTADFVVVESNGFIVRFAAKPAAITTIIVSPIALDTANKTDPIIPGKAAGITTCLIVSDFVSFYPFSNFCIRQSQMVNSRSICLCNLYPAWKQCKPFGYSWDDVCLSRLHIFYCIVTFCTAEVDK